jgi:hypothetical protein
LAEPPVENIEDRQQAFAGIGSILHLPLQPSAAPQLLAAAKESQDEVVLRRVVPVESLLLEKLI